VKITGTGGTSNGQWIRQTTTQKKNEYVPAPLDDVVNLSNAALSAAGANAVEKISPTDSNSAGTMPDPRETSLAILEAEIGLLFNTDKALTPTESNKKAGG